MNSEKEPSSERLEAARYYELRERLEDPKHLPSLKELKAIFEYSWDKGHRYDWQNYLGEETRLNPNTGRYERTQGETVRYEVLTKDYINHLSTYIQQRAQDYRATTQKPLRILEVGAGDGRLTHFLNENLSSIVKINAVDSGDRQIKQDFPVDIIKGNHGETGGLGPIKKSIEKYQPDVIVSSWMPNGLDWTREFRNTKSVKEYILIGDPDLCGHSWKTWGEDYGEEKVEGEALFKRDGFSKVYLNDLSELQVCRMDGLPDYDKHSKTVSFRKEIKD